MAKRRAPCPECEKIVIRTGSGGVCAYCGAVLPPIPPASRRKGVEGEREFARVWEAAGFEVRGLERGGDLTIVGHGLHLHGESKRQERPQVPIWIRQAERDCPADVPWVLGWRASREPWTAAVRLDTFVSLLGGDVLGALLEAKVARAFYVNGAEGMYVRLPLDELIGRLMSDG